MADIIELYTKVPARVGSLRTIDDNLMKMSPVGLSSSNERYIMLRGSRPLNKILQGDFIRIPWGTKPNLIEPSGAPNNSGPQIWIDTPTGNQLLSWNGTKYTNDNYDIVLSGEEWCVEYQSSEVGCLSSSNFRIATWPTGYSFLKFTGLPLDYRIIKIDAQLDDRGRLHHYSISVELENSDGVKRQ